MDKVVGGGAYMLYTTAREVDVVSVLRNFAVVASPTAKVIRRVLKSTADAEQYVHGFNHIGRLSSHCLPASALSHATFTLNPWILRPNNRNVGTTTSPP